MKYITMLLLSLTYLYSATAEVPLYCAQDKSRDIPRTYETILNLPESDKCVERTPLFFYQNWKAKYPNVEKIQYKTQDLLTAPNKIEADLFLIYNEIEFQKKSHPEYQNCKHDIGQGLVNIMSCDNDITMNIDEEMKKKNLTEDEKQKIVSEFIFTQGKIHFDAIVPAKNDTTEKEVVNVTDQVVSITRPNNAEIPDVTNVKTTETMASATGETAKKEADKNEVLTPDCKDQLSQEIAKLLADDNKNIIGLQYELTVLKMASLSVSEGEKTFEGLIKKKSKEVKAIDDGSIDKMNQLYKKHGLSEDAKKITEALKLKAADPNYYNKQKRFFNSDSSAFLMAYQQINPISQVKESDISVLWFMDKVSDKAKKQNKKYSSKHNRTNLSTRIAQYTGAIDPKKSLGQPKLEEMAKKQKEKIDHEFLALIDNFKINNAECFNQLFGAAPGDSECNLTKVEDVFANLLAVNSKISSTDLVDLNGKLSGKINQASFTIARYVDSPAIIPVKADDKNEQVVPVVSTKEESQEEVQDPDAFKPSME